MSTVTELAAEIQQLSAADKHLLMQLLLTDSDEAEPDAEEALPRRDRAPRESDPQWRGGDPGFAGLAGISFCRCRPVRQA